MPGRFIRHHGKETTTHGSDIRPPCLLIRTGWHLANLHGTGIFATSIRSVRPLLARTPIDLCLTIRHWLGKPRQPRGPKLPDCSGHSEAKWLTGANRLGLRFQSPKMSDCSRPEAKWLTVRTAWDFGFWIPLWLSRPSRPVGF